MSISKKTEPPVGTTPPMGATATCVGATATCVNLLNLRHAYGPRDREFMY